MAPIRIPPEVVAIGVQSLVEPDGVQAAKLPSYSLKQSTSSALAGVGQVGRTTGSDV